MAAAGGSPWNGVHVITLVLMLWFTHGIRAQGRGPERRYACWGSFGPPVVSAQCPRDTVLHVLRSGLKVQSRGGGAECAYSDGDCGCVMGELGCNMPNVRALCMGRPACRLDVTQQYINTDSCRGFSDYMYIEYNCVPETKTDIVDICSNVHESAQAGFIRSPNYPSASTYKQQCQCTLKSPGPFTLRILDFHNEGGQCGSARLDMDLDGEQQSLCSQGNLLDQDLTSQGQALLTFDSNGEGTSEGFWMKYQSESESVEVQCRLKAQSVPVTARRARPITAKPDELLEQEGESTEVIQNENAGVRQGADHDTRAQTEEAEDMATEKQPPPRYRPRSNIRNRRPIPPRRQPPIRPSNSEELRRNRPESRDYQEEPALPDEDSGSPWWWQFTSGGGRRTTVFPTWTEMDAPEEPADPPERSSPEASDRAANSYQSSPVDGTNSNPSLHGISSPESLSSGATSPGGKPEDLTDKHEPHGPGKSFMAQPVASRTPLRLSRTKAPSVATNQQPQQVDTPTGVRYYTPYPFQFFTTAELLQKLQVDNQEDHIKVSSENEGPKHNTDNDVAKHDSNVEDKANELQISAHKSARKLDLMKKFHKKSFQQKRKPSQSQFLSKESSRKNSLQQSQNFAYQNRQQSKHQTTLRSFAQQVPDPKQQDRYKTVANHRQSPQYDQTRETVAPPKNSQNAPIRETNRHRASSKPDRSFTSHSAPIRNTNTAPSKSGQPLTSQTVPIKDTNTGSSNSKSLTGQRSRIRDMNKGSSKSLTSQRSRIRDMNKGSSKSLTSQRSRIRDMNKGTSKFTKSMTSQNAHIRDTNRVSPESAHSMKSSTNKNNSRFGNERKPHPQMVTRVQDKVDTSTDRFLTQSDNRDSPKRLPKRLTSRRLKQLRARPITSEPAIRGRYKLATASRTDDQGDNEINTKPGRVAGANRIEQKSGRKLDNIQKVGLSDHNSKSRKHKIVKQPSSHQNMPQYRRKRPKYAPEQRVVDLDTDQVVHTERKDMARVIEQPGPLFKWHGHKLVPITPSKAFSEPIDPTLSDDTYTHSNQTKVTRSPPQPPDQYYTPVAVVPFVGALHPGLSAVEKALNEQRARLNQARSAPTERTADTRVLDHHNITYNVTGADNRTQVFSQVNSHPSNQLNSQIKDQAPTNKKRPQGESVTVTVITACVIGSILLIVIIGIVVRFVINRADPNYTMRQNHKKECVIRRNAHMERHGF